MCRVEFFKIGKRDVTFIREMRILIRETVFRLYITLLTGYKQLIKNLFFCLSLRYCQPRGERQYELSLFGQEKLRQTTGP